jgi:hypothetical protein
VGGKRLSGDDAELLVLEAVRVERVSGRAGTAAEVARALGRDDLASVRQRLDALVAAVECDLVDDACADCDWPAAPLGSYQLTPWGDAALAAGRSGALVRSNGNRSLEHAIELGMQAFEKTGDVREAIIEAVTRASGTPARAAARA